MSKAELRAAMRQGRKAYVATLSPDERNRLERMLADRMWEMIKSVKCFAIYAPVGSEIDPRPGAKPDPPIGPPEAELDPRIGLGARQEPGRLGGAGRG